MNRQTLKRLMVKGTVAYVAVFSLVLMVAMPAIALMANSVGTKEIRDHSIRSADIRNKAVTTDRIAPRAVRRGKIGKRAIRTEHVKYISDSKIKYSTKTRVLSISAQALDPKSDLYTFNRSSGYLIGKGIFSAPIYLPHGAVITGFKAEVYDNSSIQLVSATLRRWNSTADLAMAEVATTALFVALGWQTLSDTDGIGHSFIDNRNYAYYVESNLSGTGVGIGRIIVTYRTTRP